MKNLNKEKIFLFLKYIVGMYAVALVVSIVSNGALVPASAAMSDSTVPAVRFFATVLFVVHWIVFIFPYEIAAPWLYYFFTGNAAEMIPLFLHILLYPAILFLEVALAVIVAVGASYARPWPYYY